MKPYLIAALYLSPFFVQAQQANMDAAAETQLTVDAGLTGVQGAAELALGHRSTMQFRGGLLPMLYNPSQAGYGTTGDMKWVSALSFSGEYRHYYNFEHRASVGKNTANNGANYVGLLALFFTKPLGNSKSLPYATSGIITGPMWGFNRPLGSRFLFHLDLGPVLQREFAISKTEITLYGDARFCVKLN